MGDEPIVLGLVSVPPVELVGAGVSLVFLAAFTWFFLRSRTGIAMRAVADSQQVAMAMGINVRRYFGLAWAMAGIVSALAAWCGARCSASTTSSRWSGLKVFPVVILGGLDSVVGAVVGGIIVGVVENFAAGYLDPYVGGGTKDFAPYILMIVALMIRPYGIFGRRLIERLSEFWSGEEPRKRCQWWRIGVEPPCVGRQALNVSSRVRRVQDQLCGRHGGLSVADRPMDDGGDGGAVRSRRADDVQRILLSIVNLILIAVVGALGLNILVGYTGSDLDRPWRADVGRRLHGRQLHHPDGHAPFWVAVPAGGLMAAAIGAVIGVPSLRIKGLYLAIATLAAQLIIEWTINHVPWISGGVQASIEVPRPRPVWACRSRARRSSICSCLFFAALAIVATINLVRSRIGRAFVAIRDHDIAAEIIGIDIFRYKLIAFAISSFYAGVTGVLYTYYLGVANYEQFQINVSIDYLAMIIIGGLGSVLGSIFGAVFVTLLPIVTRWILEEFRQLVLLAGRPCKYHPQSAPGDIWRADHPVPGARAGRSQPAVAQYARLFSSLAVFVLDPSDATWEEHMKRMTIGTLALADRRGDRDAAPWAARRAETRRRS